ncbi:MAG: DNA translocase FtsK, partial [Planctomycetes bacterium]|nr:DNA translocase FtsK [Planctomycetota bacterium]
DMTSPREFIVTYADLPSADSDESGFHEIETYIDESRESDVSTESEDTDSIMQNYLQTSVKPDLSLLNASKKNNQSSQNHEIRENAALLYEALKNYGIKARIKSISMGPTVSMYEIDLAPGTKIKRLSSISSEIAMVLRAPTVRVVAPIPGKSTVGIEVPNKSKSMVIIRDMLENYEFEQLKSELPIALGLSSVGEPMYSDLAKMPHLLIAGTTGSGKSVAANIIITSILYKFSCDHVKFVLIDPKMVEFSPFRNIPHLMFPVITEVSKAPEILSLLVDEMEDRYRILERTLCKNIVEFNGLSAEQRRKRITMAGGIDNDLPDKIPYIITMIDELADLMMVAGKEIETSIVRLAQKSRAVGIHLVIATQRPSVDVITGLIKANIPCRMSFRVLSQIDSRTILDRPGAEKLLGNGDMLFLPPGSSDVLRIQNAFISNEEILQIAEFLRKQGNPNYKTMKIRANQEFEYHKDEEFIAAAEFAISCQSITAKYIAQALGVGNKKASELIAKLEDFGVIGSAQGNKAREVLMSTHIFFDRLKQKAA